MRPASSVIVSVAALMAAGVVFAVVGLRQEPDSGGVGRDSYGVRAHGYRGLLETLGELGVDARRRLSPPSGDLPADTTVALLAPSPPFVAREPAYLQALAEWVERGGRLVVAPPTEQTMARFDRWDEDEPSEETEKRPLLEVIGLDGVRVTSEGAAPDPDDDEWSGMTWPPVLRSRAQGDLDRRVVRRQRDGVALDALALPAGPVRAVDPGDLDHESVLTVRGPDDSTVVLAASFPRGDGEVVVVADPDLFANALLGQRDNALAVVGLLAPEGWPVVFDEHYHGLTVRGNALYLLTRPSFAMVTLALLAAAAIWAWRTGVALGPTIAKPPTPRRDLGEYVGAMARLLLRGSDGRRYLLGEVRQGTVEELGRQLGFTELTPSHGRVAAALERRDAPRAQAFTAAIDAIDHALANRGALGVSQTTHLMQRASSCL